VHPAADFDSVRELIRDGVERILLPPAKKTITIMKTEPVREKFELPALPYAYDALAPEFSEETLRFHHDKHHAAYVAKLNELIAGTSYATLSLEEIVCKADGVLFNNAAQAWNHTFYFAQLAPAPQPAPTGRLLKAIEQGFDSVDGFIRKASQAAAGLFGSGWLWLVREPSGDLQLVAEQNAGNPLRQKLRPLLCIDVWEHAYYIDYRNRRPDAIDAFWKRLDWNVIEHRFERE